MTAKRSGGRPVFPFAAFVRALLEWYRRDHRDLPWRRTADPYAILVSEIMLQQTQVSTVLRYFEPFLHRFPSAEALAQADEDDLLKAWEGLGYYRRARHLKRAAEVVASAGQWPREAGALAKLPGLGRSTAGAVASIAFGAPEPILDGNVRRVWSRVRATDGLPPAQEERRLWGLSGEAVRHGPPGEVNQALMELGATICTRVPRCSSCPVSGWCEALAQGNPEAYPPPKVRPKRPHHDVSVALIWRDGAFLVSRRPGSGLLGGLWELPGGKWEEGEDAESALARELREELGMEVSIRRAHPPVRHAYTHFSVTLHAFSVEPAKGQEPRSPLPLRWVRPEAIGDLAFPAGTHKIFAAVFGAEAEAAESPADYGSKTPPGRP